MENFHDILAFIEVAQHRSFKRAGETLEQSSSAVSKAVSRLEAHLNVMLLRRSTRHIALTDEGRTYLEHCRKAVAALSDAADSLAEARHSPVGTVRVHCPLVWFRERIVPQLPAFTRRYPRIQLKLVFTEGSADPVNDGYDLVVSVGAPQDARLVVRKLLQPRSVTVASPAYLQQAPPLKTPEDLAAHRCVRFISADTLTPARWHLRSGGKVRMIDVEGALDISDPASLLAAAIAGLGVVQVPEILARDALQDGRLHAVLTRYQCEGPAICVVWAHNRHMSNRVRLFLDWLTSAAHEK